MSYCLKDRNKNNKKDNHSCECLATQESILVCSGLSSMEQPFTLNGMTMGSGRN